MKFDSLENIGSGGFGLDTLPVATDVAFPTTGLVMGLLADHATHGLCVYGSDGAWHKINQ